MHQAAWQSYFSNVDERLSSITVDLNLYPIAPISGQDKVVYVSIRMQLPREDGLSDSQEAPMLWDMEDALLAGFDKAALLYSFAGTLTSNGCRDLYFYTDHPGMMEKVVVEIMAGFPHYHVAFGAKEDKTWHGYFNFLYPSPRQMQAIRNRQVLEQLEKDGDALTKEREVRHWVYFNTPKDMESFEKFAIAEGFATLNKGKTEQADDSNFVLVITRMDKVGYHEIDDYTLRLWEKAAACKGTYDGWETSVEK